MAFHPHKFGRYIIVDPIAVGGMAEIYRARLAAAKEGPDRIIVIKKVIANLQANTEFLQMFEEEIKITVGLTHPNIIQIYDYGQVEEQYFMAMEYVEGKNLRQFVKRLADMKSMFSIDMSAHIISNVCHALAYAHAYKDRMSGQPLGIVHRDISPQNVMISYDGAVKLFDFGIAKAKSASEATRAGVIKGKPSYLSPEQINGEELDGRCDIFALGIVLWELLTAKRLFVAETDMGVLRLIQSAKIEPPSTFNPAVPAALDAIVLKSLHRERNKRYQGAEEFQRDLHKFLYSFNPSFNPADLSYYAQELFKGEIRDDRERLQKFLSMQPVDAHTPVVEGAKKTAPALSTKLAEGLMSTTDFNREMMESVVGTGRVDLQVEGNTALINKNGKPPLPGAKGPPPASAPKRSGDSMVIPPWSKQTVPTTNTNSSRSHTRTATATALSREIESSSGGGMGMFAVIGLLVVGGIFGARQYGYLDNTPLAFLAKKKVEVVENQAPPPKPELNTPPSREPSSAPTVTPSGEGIVVLKTDVDGLKVTVNGHEVGLNNNQFAVPLNTLVNVDVSKPGYETYSFSTQVRDKQPVGFEIPMRAVSAGKLSFVTTPDAKITLFSGETKVFEGHTPLREEVIPAGRYKAVIENSLINYRGEMDLVIEVGKITRVERVINAK